MPQNRFPIEYNTITVGALIKSYGYEMDPEKRQAVKEIVEDGDRPYLIDHDYQRDLVWTIEYQRELVVSVIKGYPIPQIFLDNHSKRNFDYIVDGRQRTESLWRFKNGMFSVNMGEKDVYYTGLTKKQRGQFNQHKLGAAELKNWDHEDILDYFMKLQNTKPLSPNDRARAKQGDVVNKIRKNPQVLELQQLVASKHFGLNIHTFQDTIVNMVLMSITNSYENLTNPAVAAEVIQQNGFGQTEEREFADLITNIGHFVNEFENKSKVGKTHLLTIGAYIKTCGLNPNTDVIRRKGRVYSAWFVQIKNQKLGELEGNAKNYMTSIRSGNPNSPRKIEERVEMLKSLLAVQRTVADRKPKLKIVDPQELTFGNNKRKVGALVTPVKKTKHQ